MERIEFFRENIRTSNRAFIMGRFVRWERLFGEIYAIIEGQRGQLRIEKNRFDKVTIRRFNAQSK